MNILFELYVTVTVYFEAQKMFLHIISVWDCDSIPQSHYCIKNANMWMDLLICIS